MRDDGGWVQEHALRGARHIALRHHGVEHAKKVRSNFGIFYSGSTMMRMHFHYARPSGMLLPMVIADTRPQY